ncbi:hypothetical protein C7431_11484 [Pantoea allii]|uniref:Uncharacterized protein n=1 Tax=Pantoea allii TaxID=574096 RepID=A0A2V2BET5_9GAMM|nr:hypothetical protein C7431_11484 [Pantoea allii]
MGFARRGDLWFCSEHILPGRRWGYGFALSMFRPPGSGEFQPARAGGRVKGLAPAP